MSEEVQESSETTDSTPATEESAPQAEPNGAESQAAAPEETPEEKPAPFHEHPRFKEIIDQNRNFKEQLELSKGAAEKYQQDLVRLQTQMEMLREQSKPKIEPIKDKFLADLEKIDPAYSKYMETVQMQANKSAALEQRLAQFEQAQFQREAVSYFNKLLDDTKITDPMDRKIVERAVKAEVYELESQGKKLSLKDLENITKNFHAEYKASLEAREKVITAKYVQGKTQDKGTPRGATGGTAVSTGAKKLKAGDISGQAKWLADQIRAMKKEH